jgi:hypothetical protein
MREEQEAVSLDVGDQLDRAEHLPDDLAEG